MARPVRFGVTLPQIKRSWQEARAAAVEFDRLGFDSVWVCDHLHSVPMPTLPIFEAWSELAAVDADIWNNLAAFQPELGAKVEALRRRCAEVGRDFASIEVSQQCLVVVAETDDAARTGLERAQKIYGGHMGAGLEAHGIWGTPERVIDRIERHRALGCTLLVIEFFGRDTRDPARLFAEKVMPAFR